MEDLFRSRQVWAFIREHENDDPLTLILQASKYPGIPVKEVAGQIQSRKKAVSKLPEWHETEGVLFPPSLNLEQSSSEITAKFKSGMIEGENLLDLTAGTGVDAYYLSKKFKKTTLVEPDRNLCRLLKHNFEVLGKTALNVVNQTAEDYLASNPGKYDWIYIDPSRRDKLKNRVVTLNDCSPNVVELSSELLKMAPEILIKVSPMIDLKYVINQLEHIKIIKIVSVYNEVKEVLIHLQRGFKDEAFVEAWNLTKKRENECFGFFPSEEKVTTPKIGFTSRFLYEPNASIMKAGAFKLITKRFGLQKLHPNTHLYSSAEAVNNFPGKCFEIKAVLKPDKKTIKMEIPEGKANVVTRNFPMGATQIKQKFRLEDGGEMFLFFCEIEDFGFVCIKAKRISND